MKPPIKGRRRCRRTARYRGTGRSAPDPRAGFARTRCAGLLANSVDSRRAWPSSRKGMTLGAVSSHQDSRADWAGVSGSPGRPGGASVAPASAMRAPGAGRRPRRVTMAQGLPCRVVRRVPSRRSAAAAPGCRVRPAGASARYRTAAARASAPRTTSDVFAARGVEEVVGVFYTCRDPRSEMNSPRSKCASSARRRRIRGEYGH